MLLHTAGYSVFDSRKFVANALLCFINYWFTYRRPEYLFWYGDALYRDQWIIN